VELEKQNSAQNIIKTQHSRAAELAGKEEHLMVSANHYTAAKLC
jgi:hypothetical protein